MVLQMNPRTVTVGNSTSGADGNISLFTFPGEGRTIYSGIGIYYLDFTLTQRVGGRVDYTVEPKINDIKKKIPHMRRQLSLRNKKSRFRCIDDSYIYNVDIFITFE